MGTDRNDILAEITFLRNAADADEELANRFQIGADQMREEANRLEEELDAE